MKRHLGPIVAVLTVAVLAVSLPGALREAQAHGGFYLFSARFFEDLPKRLAGPGRLRFLFQPATAVLVGWGAGRSDARDRRPLFLRRIFGGGAMRSAALAETLEGVGILLLMGILVDSAVQWLLLGISYPGAALVVGPVLITVPYAAARTLAGLRRTPAVQEAP